MWKLCCHLSFCILYIFRNLIRNPAPLRCPVFLNGEKSTCLMFQNFRDTLRPLARTALSCSGLALEF
ncbi:unnamed protein product [Coffea canephora]|uniref:Secreted protein n=1 Tax=Coffea canephora TaxID=49390 RepID=A0A068U7N2_COFCA|nr:unnamed protein product [Coffea canephora]